MKSLSRLVVLTVGFLFFISSFVFSQDLMTLEEVERLIDASSKNEVKAHFESVDRGTEIKSYQVVLRGVSKEAGLKTIMFVTSHRIVAGMSGSPVYVNGKLIGALAYQHNMPDRNYDWHWGGISPISLMIKEAEAGQQPAGAGKSFNYRGMIFDPISVGNQPISSLENFSGKEFAVTKHSAILGVITYDGDYGISGYLSLDSLSRLRSFDLEFKNQGKPIDRFQIKVADSVLTPILAQAAFNMVGNMVGAPTAEEPSVTQFDVRVDLDKGGPIVWKELFASTSTRFGPSIIYSSSYSEAQKSFFGDIYDTLLNNKYGLNISNVFVSIDFIRGRSQVLKLGPYQFPNKVIWGQDPSLEIVFVSQDNLIAIAKKAIIKIDWSKVEKPAYTKETLDTDKNSEKIVRGLLRIEGAAAYSSSLSASERQKFQPEYFLGVEDFLNNLSSRLEITNRRIFVRTGLRARSGLFDEAIANAKDIMPDGIKTEEKGWHVLSGGLKERKVTLKDEGMIIFNLDLPDIPSGYIVDYRMQELVGFEVVLEN